MTKSYTKVMKTILENLKYQTKNRRFQTKSRGGFVLVELIVVIVIIMLLAALILPNLFNYINETKMRAEIFEARTAMIATQSVLQLYYYNQDPTNDKLGYFNSEDKTNIRMSERGHAEIEHLAGTKLGMLEKIVFYDYRTLGSFRYTTQRGSVVEYTNGYYEVVELY